MLPFDPQLLELVQDVAEGVDIHTAKTTLAELGFLHLPPMHNDAGVGHGAHAWVHPAGLLIGTNQVLPDQSLSGVRMGTLLNFGWGSEPGRAPSTLPTRGKSWLATDGQSMAQSNIPLIGSLSLIRLLKGLQSTQARILPFAQWKQLAMEGETRDWLFVFGNDMLQDMSECMDVGAWMGQADPDLGAFVRDRIDHLRGSSAEQGKRRGGITTKEKARRHIQRVDHVRAIAEAMELPYPTQAQSDQISQWLAEPGTAWEPDHGFLPGGLNQGSLLSIGNFEQAGQQCMLQWIDDAPVEVIEKVLLKPDATGHNLTSLLLKSMVDHGCSKQPPGAMDMGSFTAQCLDAIARKVGSQVLETALHLDGTPLGLIMGVAQDSQNRNTINDRLGPDVLQVLDILHENGVAVSDEAILPSFQPAVLIDTAQGKLQTRLVGGPREQEQFLQDNTQRTNWTGVAARIESMALEARVGPARDTSAAAPRF